MRRVLALIGVAMLLAACSRGPGPDPNQVRIMLDWTANTNHTGIYVALDKGWFEAQGLKVNILTPPEDGAVLLLAAGEAEFAIGAQESLGPALAAQLPVTAVAAIINHNTSGIMSLASAGIKRPRDLAGKRFASWETPLVTAVIQNIVAGDGGNFDEVRMISNTATDAFSALQTDVDAIWIYYAWDGIAAQVRGVPVDYLDLGAVNPLFDFYTPLMLVNNKWSAGNPETARKFMQALSRGYQFAEDNPVEAAQILLKYAPELDGELVRQSQQWLASRYRGDAPRWGQIDPARWSAFYQWMYREGLLEKNLGEAGFTNDYLP